MIVVHSRGRWRHRASAVRWWLEVKSLTIALIIACAFGVAFVAFVAVALFSCHGAGIQPPLCTAPASAVATRKPAQPDLGAPVSEVRHPTFAGKRTRPGTPPAWRVANTTRSSLRGVSCCQGEPTLPIPAPPDALMCRPRCHLRSRPQSPPQSSPRSAPSTHFPCNSPGCPPADVCDISTYAGNCP
jgi:hypothetical protein